jgi:hypothetical protein
MPSLRSSRIAPLGLLIGIGAAIIIYISQGHMLQPLVYTTYFSLIDPLQLYELAWIMATIDLLLNVFFQFSLILWVIITITIALTIRNLNIALSTLSAAILLPGGTWLLFAIKYLYLPGFSLELLINFLLWQTFIPLGIVLGLATLITLPFTIHQRQQPAPSRAPALIQSTCSKCGATYRSQPLVCIQCGGENTVVVNQAENS